MKRINNIIKGCALAAVIPAVTACSDSFLDQDPLSFFEPTTTYSTEAGLEAAMAKCDLHLKNILLDGGWNNIPMPSNYLMTDVAMHGKTDMNDGMPDDFDSKLSPTSGLGGGGDGNAMKRFWDEGYKGVKLANTVLSSIDEVKGLDETTRDAYKGRALFHRAYKYYHLVLQFGDIPLITKLVSGPKQNYSSTSKEAIFEMLVHDLEFAVEHVPSQKDMSRIGQVNKEACMQLLAKCYLVTGDYAKAEQVCSDLISNHGLKLMTEPFGVEVKCLAPQTWNVTRNVMWDLHRGENVCNSANTEMIMPILNYNEQSFTGYNIMRAIGCGWDNGAVRDVAKHRAMQSYARNNGDYIATGDWTRAIGRGIGCLRTSYFFNKAMWVYDGENDEQDLRHNRTVGNWVEMEDLTVNDKDSKHRGEHLCLYAPEDVYEEDADGTMKKITEKGELLCTDTIRCWYPTPLYKVWVLDQSSENNPGATQFNGASTGSNNNMYLFRLAETYLIRAEARFYQGNATGAAEDVNVVRRRAQAKKMFTTVTIGDIMAERARELFFEEWRQAEMARVSWCLAKSGKPDEWGNIYDKNNWDKQAGTDRNGGSYWYRRCITYGIYNHGPIITNNRSYNYQVNKRNLFWPIPNDAITANNKAPLRQNYGYDGYDENVKMFTDWQEAVADEDRVD